MTYETENLDPFAFAGRSPAISTTEPPGAKFDFIAAEAEMEALHDLAQEFQDAGDHSDETLVPICNRINETEEAICRAAPASLVDVAVKLRTLTQDGGGLDASNWDGYNASVAQVLTFLDDSPAIEVDEIVGRRILDLRPLCRPNAEASDDEMCMLHRLRDWAESKVRRSKDDWPSRRARIEGGAA